ncbi:MAG: hypothetical protein E7319_04875 [Clostridiales bacterium]|nr:hypothetical protein [Clostridiales bacterium]
MPESPIAFLIWAAVGAGIVAAGIAALFARKPVGFWANVETPPVSNVKKYNLAVGWLFIAFGAVFVLLGLPLLSTEGQVWILLSSLGVMGEVIAAMIVYTLVIEKKYTKKQGE